ncbi:MAG: TIGR04282 family arsenosugar biosynthesis glycosyltransferase [Chloroflexi bacterium]|nr:TIGR04282 family arsenosugar biosynthesis glycosyltransferase [Chloroflexota bacterium]
MSEALVYVVAKAPRPGAVKTRLCPPLRPEQAAALYQGMLLDSIAAAATVPDVRIRAICPDETDASALARLLDGTCEVVAQHGAGLGAALEECFAEGLRSASTVLVMSSDNPTLPSGHIAGAIAALATCDVVFGPSDDGGYYLVAARRTFPSLFREMTWSTNQVLAQSLERCTADGLTVHLQERWYDVDDRAGLLQLQADLGRTDQHHAVHTRRAFAALGIVGELAGTP